MSDRFLERLSEGPPIVADGGMGMLISSAVSRLRCPEEANLRAPESAFQRRDAGGDITFPAVFQPHSDLQGPGITVRVVTRP